jgi:hypothetical protein
MSTQTTGGPFSTINEIKAANKAKGHHWFSEGTMEFFGSQIESGVIGGRYFVTSEKTGFEDDGTRVFSVRVALDDGSIDTVGEFQEHVTLDSARAAARRFAKEDQGA